MRRLIFGLICLSLLFAGGCRQSWPFQDSRPEARATAKQMAQYQQAIAAYQNMAYTDAAKSFEDLRTRTADKRLRRLALYGLACSRLMAAETPTTYNDALYLWQQWVENAPKKFDDENPVMTDALIREKMLFSNIPLSLESTQETASEPMVPRWLLIRSKAELDRLRSELDEARKTLNKRKELIHSREKKIGELKRQIKALEAIDQKIQKKKDAIPSEDSVIKKIQP